MTPPVTPEPLSEQELDKFEKLIGLGFTVKTFDSTLLWESTRPAVLMSDDELRRLIAQARAATNEHAERTRNSLTWLRDQLKQRTEEYEAAVAAMQQPTLAVRQRLEAEREKARAARPSPWQPIATARGRKEPFFAYFRRKERDEYRQIVESSETALATLRERVRQLPSPWLCRFERSHFTTDEGRYVGKCDWCGTTSSRDGGNVPDHPDNGCLWPEVHKPVSAPKEPTPHE